MSIKSFLLSFRYNRSQRNGTLILLFIALALQFFLIFSDKLLPNKNDEDFEIPKALQKQYDSLVALAQEKKKPKIYPFNPNYLTDYRGYYLGMSMAEIDRVFAFRKAGNYFQSKKQFMEVSGISDSLYQVLEPYINIKSYYQGKHYKRTIFPSKNIDINKATPSQLALINGVGEVLSKRIVKYRNSIGGFSQKNQLNKVYGLEPEVINRVWNHFYIGEGNTIERANEEKSVTEIKDINSATANDLKSVYGIGDKLSKRIVKYRESIGGFAVKEQLNDVFGLEPEVIQRVWKQFDIKTKPKISIKIDLNDANIKELAQNPYISYQLAKNIVSFRTLHGAFATFDGLFQVKDYPREKHKQICLYLTLEK